MWKPALSGTLIAAAVAAGLFAYGCGTFQVDSFCAGRGTASAMTMRSPARHEAYVARKLPVTYQGLGNPYLATIGNLVDGARIYDQRCASCHGMMGIGDGEAGVRLEVPPADLSRSLGQPLYRDDFFYWSIAEGGAEFDTAMPAFKNDLKPGEIWKTLTFMRAAFAEESGTAQDLTAPP
jgi:high-affinity iron transporter